MVAIKSYSWTKKVAVTLLVFGFSVLVHLFLQKWLAPKKNRYRHERG